MDRGEIVSIARAPELAEEAAAWFHEKWGVPLAAYRESMAACVRGEGPVPRWYVYREGGRIIAGAGVIENDFHRRPDLAPNLCALYVEPDCRRRGLAGLLLGHICRRMAALGVDTLYLITDHVGFYERYGWTFLCMVEEDGGGTARMYCHREHPAE